jgi:hypothetical protein
MVSSFLRDSAEYQTSMPDGQEAESKDTPNNNRYDYGGRGLIV